MKELFEVFSTREIAFLIWVLIVLVSLTFVTEVRKAIGGILKIIFGWRIFLVLLSMLFYVSGIVYIFWKINFWEISLLKDTTFWFFSFAIVTFFTINKAEDNSFFQSLFLNCFKWTIFIEFFVNFYTFSLTTELIMFPIIVFVGLIQAISQADKKYEPVTKLFSNILLIIGAIFFLYALYKTIEDFQVLFTIENLNSILLPIFLTILLLPFLYGLALYMKYETLFIRVRFMSNNNDKKIDLNERY